MGYNDHATLALKLCGTICLIRACMYTIYPETLTSIIGYPPAPAAGGWGKKAGNGPSEEDVLSVIISVQFYGLVQGGIAGLCLSTARVGHPYTMSVVSTVLGTLFFVLCVYASSVLGKEGLEHVNSGVIKKVVAPLGALSVYMLYVGVSGVRKAAPAGEPLGKSGKMMAVVSVFSMMQGLVPLFLTDKYIASFGLSIAHPSTEGTVKLMLRMWGMSLVAGSFARFGVVYATHTDSIYAACRALVIYLSQVGSSLMMVSSYPGFNPNPKSNPNSNPNPNPNLDPDPRPNPNPNQLKSLGKANRESLGYQCLLVTFYFFLTYFGGIIADDNAAVEAKSAASKGKKGKK